jgi:sugar lactone lactonase YvrE
MIQQPRSLKAKTATLSLSALGLAVFLTGCAGNTPANFGIPTSPVTGAVKASGMVHGGQNPVTAATIQLYTVGTTGNAASATPLLTSTVTTSDGTGQMNSNANAGNANNTLPAGSFSLNNAYTCTGSTPGTQVYIVATGGNPGGGTNTAVALAAALGNCATLNSSFNYISMNEVTTVAAAYALAPFATNLTHVGSASSLGITNAFAIAQSLANVNFGTAGGAALPSGTVAPVSEINTLADILAACINGASTSSSCTSLFSAAGGSDTFTAAIGIAKKPGLATVTALYSLSSAQAPFQPTLTSQPKDFTVALNYTANGSLATPYGIAIDASGNAWIANESGTAISELSPTGALLASPTISGMFGPQGIAIDRAGNVWVANTAGNSVVKFTLASGAVSSSNSFSGDSTQAPTALAIDSAGNVFVANYNGNSVLELNQNGVAQNGSPFTGNGNNITNPTGIAVGPTGAVYVTSGAGYAVKLTNTGAFSANITDNALQGPSAIAVTSSGQIAFPGSTTGTSVAGALSEFTDSGTSIAQLGLSPVSSGLSTPAGIATDGSSFWIANSSASGGLARFTYGAAASTAPASGYGTLNTPIGVAVDPSGCVWTANSGDNTVTQFIGIATPTATPLATNVGP